MNTLKHIATTVLVVILLTACKKEVEEKQPPANARQENIEAIDGQVEDFIAKYNVPGASLAVSKNGKLVYRKGYGFADKEAQEKVTPEHRFRLASISKTYTGVAIMKLVQEGKIKLDDKVFGTTGILGTQYGTKAYSTNLSNITVRHLLHNTGGGWGAASGGDPIDQHPQMNNEAFMNWVLDNRPVQNAPGTRYDYSNMGYFILGRIIEKISGKSYSNYIRQNIADVIDDKATDIAGPKLADRKPGEVKYYGQGTDIPYVYTIALNRRDADGGLMTTATDLLRLVTAIDGSPTRPDILNPASLTALTTGSGPAPLNPSYGLGIGLWNEIWYNYGSLPGTRTGFMRSTNGTSIALLLNSRQENNTFIYAMQDLMVSIVNNATVQWQDIDQF
jgi:D-alanyl-D-alanine carboxypeptidase